MKGFLNKDERQIIYRKLHPADWEMWRVAHNPRYRPNIDIEYIVKNGYLDIIAWMNEPQRDNAYNYAFNNQDLKVLQCLKDNNYQFDPSMGTNAVDRNYLKVLQWIKDNNIPETYWTSYCKPSHYWLHTCRQALFYGTLDAFKLVYTWCKPKYYKSFILINNAQKHNLDWLATLPIP
jgi:hypothetical protein